jgi:stearoyl-CoA desaturase (delta-9 desaturase)
MFYLIGGINCVIYYLFAPAVIYILHANLITNTLSHGFILPGTYRNFNTDDSSTNHWLCQFLTLGEGYQNNHHKDCTTCSQATKPGEFDPAAWVVDKFFAIKEKENV